MLVVKPLALVFIALTAIHAALFMLSGRAWSPLRRRRWLDYGWATLATLAIMASVTRLRDRDAESLSEQPGEVAAERRQFAAEWDWQPSPPSAAALEQSMAARQATERR